MSHIYVPSSGPEAWKQFLAKPNVQWRKHFSARTLANSWEAADGLPREIRELFAPVVGETELLLALPEHRTLLAGGRRESQSDVFALIRCPGRLIATTIEGKVDETFGPTLAEWLQDASAGKTERLLHIRDLLGLPTELDGSVRYQLLHRTAAAVIEAERFAAGAAAMIVHSFSPTARWFGDFARFVTQLGGFARPGRAEVITLPGGRPLYLGWARGEQRFRTL
jgi:hypothetical protein